MTKTISTHVTALLSGATSILALLHPGFHLNPAVQGVAVGIPALIAGAIEALHFVKHHNLNENLLAAEHFLAGLNAHQVAQAAEAAAPEAAPTTPAA